MVVLNPTRPKNTLNVQRIIHFISKADIFRMDKKVKHKLYAIYKKCTLNMKKQIGSKCMQKPIYNSKQEKAAMTILKSDKMDCKTKSIPRNKENYFIMINRLVLELL